MTKRKEALSEVIQVPDRRSHDLITYLIKAIESNPLITTQQISNQLRIIDKEVLTLIQKNEVLTSRGFIIPERSGMRTAEAVEPPKPDLSFIMIFENGLPVGTAQQKGECIKKDRNGKEYIHHYRTAKVSNARTEFLTKLYPNRPKEPLLGPVEVYIRFTFSVKDKKLWNRWKDTKPDTDGYLKEFKDCLEVSKFVKNDSQMAREIIEKVYGETSSIEVSFRRLEGKAK